MPVHPVKRANLGFASRSSFAHLLALVLMLMLATPACGRGDSKRDDPRTVALPQPQPAPAPVPSRPRAPEKDAADLPAVTFASASTYADDNKHHWLEVALTLSNPTSVIMSVDRSELRIAGGCPMGAPGPTGAEQRRRLAPGEAWQLTVSWSCYPPPGTTRAMAKTVSLWYQRAAGAATARTSLPVEVLPTRGLALRLSGAVRARISNRPHPETGEVLDLCTAAEARNVSKGPIIFVPMFMGSVIAPTAGGATRGWLGNRYRRVEAGSSVSGQLCWRFDRVGRPPERLRVTHVADPSVSVELAVPR